MADLLFKNISQKYNDLSSQHDDCVTFEAKKKDMSLDISVPVAKLGEFSVEINTAMNKVSEVVSLKEIMKGTSGTLRMEMVFEGPSWEERGNLEKFSSDAFNLFSQYILDEKKERMKGGSMKVKQDIDNEVFADLHGECQLQSIKDFSPDWRGQEDAEKITNLSMTSSFRNFHRDPSKVFKTFLKLVWIGIEMKYDDMAQFSLQVQRHFRNKYGVRPFGCNDWHEVIPLNQFEFGKRVPITVDAIQNHSLSKKCMKHSNDCFCEVPVYFPLSFYGSNILDDSSGENSDEVINKFSLRAPYCTFFSYLKKFQTNSVYLDLSSFTFKREIISGIFPPETNTRKSFKYKKIAPEECSKDFFTLEKAKINNGCAFAYMLKDEINKFKNGEYKNCGLRRIEKNRDVIIVELDEYLESRYCIKSNSYHGITSFRVTKDSLSMVCSNENCNKISVEEPLASDVSKKIFPEIISLSLSDSLNNRKKRNIAGEIRWATSGNTNITKKEESFLKWCDPEHRMAVLHDLRKLEMINNSKNSKISSAAMPDFDEIRNENAKKQKTSE